MKCWRSGGGEGSKGERAGVVHMARGSDGMLWEEQRRCQTQGAGEVGRVAVRNVAR